MQNIKISLLMPVYNTEIQFLAECVKSIKKRSFSEWELCIIDDGSNKDTADYCESLTIDERIKVFHQKNKGVGSSRNTGTKIAQGDYVMYVDSDDVLAPFALEEAINVANEYKADIVYGGVIKVNSHKSFYNSLCDKKGSERRCVDANVLRKRFFGEKVKGLCDIQGGAYVGRGPVARLIKRSIALSVEFPLDMPIGEDLVWNLRILNKSNKNIIVNSIWYGYVEYSNSSISKYYGNRSELVVNFLNVIKDENSSFFNMHKDIVGCLLARELYCIIKYDKLLLSNHKVMQKNNKSITSLLRSEPWALLSKSEYNKSLSKFQRIFLLLCYMGYGVSSIFIYNKIKDIKNQLKYKISSF